MRFLSEVVRGVQNYLFDPMFPRSNWFTLLCLFPFAVYYASKSSNRALLRNDTKE